MYINKQDVQLSSSRWLSGIDLRLAIIKSSVSWVRAPRPAASIFFFNCNTLFTLINTLRASFTK